MVALASATAKTPTAEIAPGVMMPKINLGTCCGSQPNVGLGPWLDAGANGIDTAYDYGKGVPGGKQSDIAAVLKKRDVKREDVFITTKIPAGLGISPKDCALATPESTVAQVKENLKELSVDYVDLVLLHAPCKIGGEKANAALWKGLEQALAQNLTRAIGVSSYKVKDLTALLTTAKTIPAVNQCDMSATAHDDETIAFSQAHNITYEAFFAMKGCPFNDPAAKKIATAHSKSVAQVCLRYVLQRGCVMATGTGDDSSTCASYAKEDTDIFDFVLTDAEMKTVGSLKPPK
jgi:diketogulonate reductase-like aldo/keto reductase